jgi:hypothetical protein
MVKMKNTFLLLVIILSISNILTAQVTDSTGIPIEEREFRSLIICQLANFNSDTAISVDDAIIMIRIFNTLFFDENFRASNSLYVDFFGKVADTHLNIFFKVKELNLVIRGGSIFSKKYNLSLGRRPHCNSIYVIVPNRSH